MAKDETRGGDWRSADAYRPLLDADASAWAWEFARRGGDAPPPDLCFAGPGPERGGAPTAMWRFEADPAVPVFQHLPAAPGQSGVLNLRSLNACVLLAQSQDGDQHVLIADGDQRLRFAVVGGDLLQGPAGLGFVLPGPEAGGAWIDAVRRLVVLRDTGRLPRAARTSRARAARWMEAVRAFDARRSGASQREIARLIFGEARVAADWNGPSDYMRMRVQRLVRSAEQLVAGGYRAFFGLRPPAQTPRITRVWRSDGWPRAFDKVVDGS
jgi:hypothetical protein